MARRKQNQFFISIDAARWGIVIVLISAALFISWVAMSSYVRHSGIFMVKNVEIEEKLGEVNVPELAKLKGKNIFAVDLERVYVKILAQYPQIADLKVMRRFPDVISIEGERRVPFARALVEGRNVAVSRDGYFIGAPGKGDEDLVLVKGVQRQKFSAGTKINDSSLESVFQGVEQIQRDTALDAFHLYSLDISDSEKIIFCFGRSEDAARFDVIVDKSNCIARLKTLSVMIAKTQLAINEVKYIDLRFDAPVIGKKKAKK